jgi:hypothetical protein
VKSGLILVLLLSFACWVGCHNPQDALTNVAKSHVEANVPPGKLFDELLRRDLNSYFCKDHDCEIKYEFLRDGPTQSGTSYPKFYLWVKIIEGGIVAEEGAARVAAVEQKRFDVTHFLSREQISQSPSQVASIFPAPVADRIAEKTRSSSRSQD